MTIVSKLSKSPSTTLDNRQSEDASWDNSPEGRPVQVHRGKVRGVSTGPLKLDYTLGSGVSHGCVVCT
jgi:hypothetical protein